MAPAPNTPPPVRGAPTKAVVPSSDRAAVIPNRLVPEPALLRVAVGVPCEVQDPASVAWKMYAAPLPPVTPGAPTSAVVPSPDRETASPRSGPEAALAAAEADLMTRGPSRA